MLFGVLLCTASSGAAALGGESLLAESSTLGPWFWLGWSGRTNCGFGPGLPGVVRAAGDLQAILERVTGLRPVLARILPKPTAMCYCRHDRKEPR